MIRHDAKAIANYFLDLAKGGPKLTPLKIQKLVYFAHGWNLALTKQPLLNEMVEAWKYGPVIPSLYHEFKIYGGSPIEQRAINIEMLDNGYLRRYEPSIQDACAPEEAELTAKLLKRIWEVYKGYSGLQLSELTHRPGTPWEKIRAKVGDVKNADIPNELILEYFQSQIAQQKT